MHAEGLDTTLYLNGVDIRSKFFVKTYMVGLYLPAKDSIADTIRGSAKANRIAMQFLRNVVTEEENGKGVARRF